MLTTDMPDEVRLSMKLMVASFVFNVLTTVLPLFTMSSGWEEISLAERNQRAAAGAATFIRIDHAAALPLVLGLAVFVDLETSKMAESPSGNQLHPECARHSGRSGSATQRLDWDPGGWRRTPANHRDSPTLPVRSLGLVQWHRAQIGEQRHFRHQTRGLWTTARPGCERRWWSCHTPVVSIGAGDGQ